MSKKLKTSKDLVPVTIITGFLGSGKTTLLNHILKSPDHGLRFAIIENEFGDVGVDDGVLKQTSEDQIIEMMNGCVCCTVRKDLVDVLKKLSSERFQNFDAVLIETTGLADPAPVAQTFFVDDEISGKYKLDGIVTVIDCAHAKEHLEEEKPEGVENEAVEQVAFADRILMNKIDLVDEAKICELEKKIKSINTQAKLIRTDHSQIDPHELLNIQAFSLDRVVAMDPEFLDTDGEHEHDKSVSSLSFKFEGSVNVSHLQDFIQVLMQESGQDLFRYKGLLAVKGMDMKFIFQGVHMLFQGGFDPDYPWKPDEKRECRFVFIGRNLDHDKIRKGFLECKVDESKPLRFKAGDKVFANVGGYEPGTIMRLWDEGNPYRIKLDSGEEVWGPIDVDLYVKGRS